MAFKDFMSIQREGAASSANAGVIGMHMVSGPAVGFALGYGLDAWLATTPWCGIAFLFIGIGAGFLNVWRDTRSLVAKMESKKRKPD